MDLNELLVDPTGVQTWRLGESELLTSTTELSQRICELEALRLRMVTDLDTRGTAKTLGASSTAAWLSGATRMSPGSAAGMVHLGRALTERGDTAEALAAGRISTAHAKVVTGFFAHLPDGVPDDALAPCECYLLDAAAVDNPAELARRAAALRHLLEPVEGGVPDAENVELNELFATVVVAVGWSGPTWTPRRWRCCRAHCRRCPSRARARTARRTSGARPGAEPTPSPRCFAAT